ncbi:MAG TPA: hypothetical protein VIO59_10385 [Rhodanobacter sp.]
MENKRNRTAATGANKARPSKRASVVEPAQEFVTYSFELDQIRSIEVKAMAVVVPRPRPRTMALRMSSPQSPQSPPPSPQPRFNVCVNIVVVPKPPL